MGEKEVGTKKDDIDTEKDNPTRKKTTKRRAAVEATVGGATANKKPKNQKSVPVESEDWWHMPQAKSVWDIF